MGMSNELWRSRRAGALQCEVISTTKGYLVQFSDLFSKMYDAATANSSGSGGSKPTRDHSPCFTTACAPKTRDMASLIAVSREGGYSKRCRSIMASWQSIPTREQFFESRWSPNQGGFAKRT